eukprot:139375_1
MEYKGCKAMCSIACQDLINAACLSQWQELEAELEAALATQVTKEYLQKLGNLNPYKKNAVASNIDIETASGVLLRALVYHPSRIDIELTQKQGAEFGFSPVSPSLQTTAKSLDVQRKKDALSAALKDRPSPEVVMDKNVTQLGYDVTQFTANHQGFGKGDDQRHTHQVITLHRHCSKWQGIWMCNKRRINWQQHWIQRGDRRHKVLWMMLYLPFNEYVDDTQQHK